MFGHTAETDLEDESQRQPGAAPKPGAPVTHHYAPSFIPLSPTPVMCEPCHMGTSFCLLHTVTEEAEKKGWEGGRSLCSEGISRRRSCTL